MTTQTFSTGAKLTPFLLDEPARAGVLILPGGGYGHLAVGHEGRDIGAWLNARGYDAWMLEYRVVGEQFPAPLETKPLEDVGLALEAIRANERGGKLGIWGFSAGGHLAAMAATSPALKLDFAVLAYPVIDLISAKTHAGSRRNLLGDTPDEAQLKAASPHLRVGASAPPMFLFHTADDSAVPVKNSLDMAQALAEHKVPFELHIYPHGSHGLGLALQEPYLANWSERLEAWLLLR